MSNKRKKRRNNKTDKTAIKPTKKFPLKKLGILVGLFALSTALYYAVASAGYGIVYPIYVAVCGGLFVAYFAMNKGLVSIPEREQLSDSMTEKEKDEFLAEVKANKKRSEPILLIFIAMLLTVLCDSVYAQLSSGPLGDLLSKLGGTK